jgi:NAD-dependent DNA ligase
MRYAIISITKPTENTTMENDIFNLYQHGRMAARQIDELVGICKGATLDGVVSEGEAEYLLQWLEANRQCADTWPASILYERLSEMLIDGILDQEERRELLELLCRLSGGQTIEGANASTSLPLDKPPPVITFTGKLFCVTGTFSYGPRSKVHQAIEASGGLIAPGIKKDLNYLVIGSIGTESWKHSSFGNKIIKTMEYKAKGYDIAVVSEHDWMRAIG